MRRRHCNGPCQTISSLRSRHEDQAAQRNRHRVCQQGIRADRDMSRPAATRISSTSMTFSASAGSQIQVRTGVSVAMMISNEQLSASTNVGAPAIARVLIVTSVRDAFPAIENPLKNVVFSGWCGGSRARLRRGRQKMASVRRPSLCRDSPSVSAENRTSAESTTGVPRAPRSPRHYPDPVSAPNGSRLRMTAIDR